GAYGCRFREADLMRRFWFISIMVLAPAATEAQIRVICQTPQFWCAFFTPMALPSGTGCHCGTPMGPAFGFSIVDAGMPQPLPQPMPQPMPQPQPIPGQETSAADCYRGLGNCGGAYSR